MGRTVVDSHAQVLLTKNTTPAEQYDNPEINRNDLRTLLLDSLTSGTVVWDSKFTDIEQLNSQWLIHFNNNVTATADVVIGANGGMSKARKYVTDAEIEYTGTLIIQGEVTEAETRCKEFYRLCNDNILMTANQGTLLVANPQNNNLLSYNVIFAQPEDWENGLNFEDKGTCFSISFEQIG